MASFLPTENPAHHCAILPKLKKKKEKMTQGHSKSLLSSRMKSHKLFIACRHQVNMEHYFNDAGKLTDCPYSSN